MAMLTYADITNRVLAIIGKSDNDTRDRIKDSINNGYNDFVTRELWPFREVTDYITTIAGTQEYTLSTEFTDIDQQNIISVAIQGASARKLEYKPYNQLRSLYPDFDEDGTGLPTMYYIKGGAIGFYLSPGDVYTVAVDYFKVPTALSADADTPIIPATYREALVHYALSDEHDFNTDPDLAVKAMNTYENFVAKARNNLLAQPTDNGNFVITGPQSGFNHTDIGY